MGVLANTFTVSNNATIAGTLGVTGLTSLVSAALSGSLSVTGLTSLGTGTYSGTLSVSGNSTVYGTLSTSSGGSNKFVVDNSGNISTPGSLTLTTPIASYVTGGTALSSTFSVATTSSEISYHQYFKFACDATTFGQLYGGFLGYGIVANQQTFTTYGVIFNNVIKEAIRLSAPASGSNVYVGINNTAPVHTLDIVNRVSTVNALNIKNAAASSTILTVTDAGNTTIGGTLGVTGNTTLSGTLTVTGNTTNSGTLTVTGVTTHTGAVTLSPTGSNTVLTVGGTAYSASTVQAALALPTAPVFTGNITLPTTVTAPLVGQLGYTTTVYGTAQSGANPLQILNLAQTSLGVGVWHIIGTMQYNTPDSGNAFTQVVTAISTTSTNYDSQTAGFVRTYNSGSGGDFSTYTYSQQVHRILTLTTATTVYVTGTVSATFMTTWGTPSNGSSLQAVRIA